MKNERLRTLTREENLDLGWNPSGEGEEVEWEVFRREMREFLSREIGEKWKKITLTLYIDKYVARWISRYREVSRIKNSQMELSRSYREVSIANWPWWIEKLSSIYQANRNFLNGSRSCQEGIETNSQKRRWIKNVITSVEKGRSRGSIDSLAIERYREDVEMLKK